jgi:putative aldouronate transport system permease protein
MSKNRVAKESAHNGRRYMSVSHFIREVVKMRYYYFLLIPAIIWFLVFCYYPMYGVIIAFKNYRFVDGIIGSEWVGLFNFVKLFRSPSIYDVLKNTISISLLRIVFGFPAPILLALLFNEIRNAKFLKITQTITYLPYFMSWVVLGGMLAQMLSPSSGIINQVIKVFGGQPIYFLTDTNWFVPALIASGVWQSIGWGSVIYIAVISGIDVEMYQSADIEGASRLQKAIYITLPHLGSTISIMLILTISGLMNAGFDQIFNMYNPSVYKVADILDTYVYRTGLQQMNYSESAAVGLFKNVIGFILLVSTNRIVKAFRGQGIW